jgi:heme/copper-type cytochrome/quinol oxidase subunit 2
MKRFLACSGLLLAFLVPATATQALTRAAKAPAINGACAKVNATAKTGSTALICRKSGKKLTWQKVAPKPKPSTSITPSSTPSSTQSPSSPSPTATPASGPTIGQQSSYEVNVNAKAFSWSFTYAVAGEKSARLGIAPTMYLPVGKPVQLNIISLDTSHGFWVPGLGIDKEAAADATAHVTITAEKIGKFPGACNIQCGRGHAGMQLTAEVVSESDYLKIIGALKSS